VSAFAFAAAAQSFTGHGTCSSCHPAQFETQSASAHARSLAPSSDTRISSHWAFGAGTQAITFVSRLDESYYLEHNLSYYSSAKAYAPTPGHHNQPPPGVRYRIFDPSAAILRCFQCHSTGTVSLGEGNRIEPSELGVRCEACHGPGAAHAKSPTRSNIINPKTYSATELNDLCGSCHRKPAALGEDTDWNNAWNVRHQPLYLAESACFQKSGGKLSCLTCHDAHSGKAREACSSCHPAVKHRAATRAAGRSCSGCHMPVVRPGPHLAFANHWIGVYATGSALRPLRRATAPGSPRTP
jgi:hypothetical protein